MTEKQPPRHDEYGRYGLQSFKTSVATLLPMGGAREEGYNQEFTDEEPHDKSSFAKPTLSEKKKYSTWALRDFPLKTPEGKKIVRVAFTEGAALEFFHFQVQPHLHAKSQKRQRTYGMYQQPFLPFPEEHKETIRQQIASMGLKDLDWHIEFTQLPVQEKGERDDHYQKRLKEFAKEAPVIMLLRGGVTFEGDVKAAINTMVSDVPSFFEGYGKQPRTFFTKYNEIRGPQGLTKRVIIDDDKSGPLAKMVVIPKNAMDLPNYQQRIFKHEFCHALGLKHADEGMVRDSRLDYNATIMGKHLWRGHLPEIYATLTEHFTALEAQYTANPALSREWLVDELTQLVSGLHQDPRFRSDISLTPLDRAALALSAQSFQTGTPYNAKEILNLPLFEVQSVTSPEVDGFRPKKHGLVMPKLSERNPKKASPSLVPVVTSIQPLGQSKGMTI